MEVLPIQLFNEFQYLSFTTLKLTRVFCVSVVKQESLSLYQAPLNYRPTKSRSTFTTKFFYRLLPLQSVIIDQELRLVPWMREGSFCFFAKSFWPPIKNRFWVHVLCSN